MVKKNTNLNYEVGYKKPPKHTQFKKGQSGNLKGRKKGSKNYKPLSYALPPELFRDAVLEEAYRTVPVNEAGDQVHIPLHQAILRSVMIQAAKGNTRSQKIALEIIKREEGLRRKEAEERAGNLIDYKQNWEQKLLRGYSGERPCPHPDQIKINMQTGQMEVVGPLSKEEYEENEYYKKRLSNSKNNLRNLVEELKREKDKVRREAYQSEIDHYNKMIPLLEGLVFDEDKDLSLYEEAKKDGSYAAYMKGPDAYRKHIKKKLSRELGEDDLDED